MNSRQALAASTTASTPTGVSNAWMAYFGAVVLNAGITFSWLQRNLAPPWWDQSLYLLVSEKFYQALARGQLLTFADLYVNSFDGGRAPLIALLPQPSYLLLGHGPLAINLSLTALVVVFGWAYYKFLRELMNGTQALFAYLIVSTMPLVYGLSRQFLVEFGLMILVTLWAFLQHRSQQFTSIKYDAWLGIVLGLGLLMKVSFPLYVFGMVIFDWVVFSRSRRPSFRLLGVYALRNLLILAIGLLIAASWYFKNLGAVLGRAISAGFGAGAANYSLGNPFGIATVLSYWQTLEIQAVSPYYVGLSLVLAVAYALLHFRHGNPAMRRSPTSRFGLLLLAWCAPPLVALTLGTSKDVRFVLPLLPGVAAGIAFLAVAAVERTRLRLLLPVLLVFPLFEYCYDSLPLCPNPAFAACSWPALDPCADKYSFPPSAAIWPQQTIIADIQADAAAHNIVDPKATLVIDNKLFNQWNFRYYAAYDQAEIEFTALITANQADWDANKGVLDQADYLITKTGDQGPAFTNYANDQVKTMLIDGTLPFRLIHEYPLPDQSAAALYRRVP